MPPPLVCVQRGQAARPTGGSQMLLRVSRGKGCAGGPGLPHPQSAAPASLPEGLRPLPGTPPTAPCVLCPSPSRPCLAQGRPLPQTVCTPALQQWGPGARASSLSTLPRVWGPQGQGLCGARLPLAGSSSGETVGREWPTGGRRLGQGRGGCGGRETHPQGWGGCRPSACRSGSGHAGNAGRAVVAEGTKAEVPG